MKTEKIGEVNFEEFKTEFKITPKVKKFLEEENYSLACLLPNGWEWYEVELFDNLDENRDGEPDLKYGKNFEVIYYAISEALENSDWDNENSKPQKWVNDEIKGEGKFISDTTQRINGTPKNKDKNLDIRYSVYTKK